MLSVLFALVLNEWRADAKQRDEADIALNAIKAEIQNNIEGLTRAYSQHKAIYDTLNYYEKMDEFPPPEIYFEEGLFQPAGLYSTAWETSIQTGTIDEFPYEMILNLSKIYKDQTQYEQLGGQIVNETYITLLKQGSNKALRDNYKNWSVIILDFYNREARLKDKLENILIELEKKE
ncbi:MAG: hypothetical protein Tsb0034_20190 [Ekhidna sp.]